MLASNCNESERSMSDFRSLDTSEEDKHEEMDGSAAPWTAAFERGAG